MTSNPNSYVGVTASSPSQANHGVISQQIPMNVITNSQSLTGVPQVVQGLPQPAMGHRPMMPQTVTQAPTSVVASAGPTLAVPTEAKVLDKRRLQELIKEVDPLEQIDEDVEEVLMQIADDFIENVVAASCKIAKHRKSNSLDVKDVQLHLERSWGMWVPGFGTDELRPYKRASTTEAHKQRLALIRKTLKKS